MASTSPCKNPSCEGTVRFTEHPDDGHRLEIGACDRCGLLHRRVGGRVRMIASPAKDRCRDSSRGATPARSRR